MSSQFVRLPLSAFLTQAGLSPQSAYHEKKYFGQASKLFAQKALTQSLFMCLKDQTYGRVAVCNSPQKKAAHLDWLLFKHALKALQRKHAGNAIL
jgi:hypothetical protein